MKRTIVALSVIWSAWFGLVAYSVFAWYWAAARHEPAAGTVEEIRAEQPTMRAGNVRY